MARRLRLLVLDSLDGFGERGAAANVAALVIAIVVAHCVSQHIVKRIWPDLCALPMLVGDRVGVHRGIPFVTKQPSAQMTLHLGAGLHIRQSAPMLLWAWHRQ